MISLEEAKLYLKVENTDEDDLITQLIDTSKKLCEHRETANYKELKQMLYHLLLADRKDIF